MKNSVETFEIIYAKSVKRDVKKVPKKDLLKIKKEIEKLKQFPEVSQVRKLVAHPVASFRTFGLPVITVRPSNNYGPWQYPEKLIPVVILKALNNERIPVYGKGENIREWLYVSDCTEAVFSVIKKGKPGEIYNIGSGFEKRNIDVVKTILELLNKPEDLISFVKDRPGHDFRYSLNTEKIQREIGWRAKTSFEEGIEKTVKWYLDNLDWVNEKLGYLRRYWERVYEEGK